MKWIRSHKLAVIFTLVGIGLWFFTGIDYFLLLAPAMFFAGLALRSFPRTFLWIGLGVYGSLIMTHGWILAILLIFLVAVFFPSLRNITPIGDFKGKSKPKQKQDA